MDDLNFLLVINEITILEQINDSLLNTSGKLRVLFNNKLLISHYEFVSFKHIEIGPKDLNDKSKITVNGCTELTNEFGIPAMLSRSLIIAESISEIIPTKTSFIDEYADRDYNNDFSSNIDKTDDYNILAFNKANHNPFETKRIINYDCS